MQESGEAVPCDSHKGHGFGSFSSVAVHEGNPPRKPLKGTINIAGGQSKTNNVVLFWSFWGPLTPAHQEKLDEPYSNIFLYPKTDDKLEAAIIEEIAHRRMHKSGAHLKEV